VCQLDVLKECTDPLILNEALGDLPQGLHETYDRIVQSISNKQQRTAIRILQFLAYSKRPLLLEEIVHAIAVRPDRNPTFNVSHCMPNPEEVISYCRSLTRISYRMNDRRRIAEL
jgi:hypothetical protein